MEIIRQSDIARSLASKTNMNIKDSAVCVKAVLDIIQDEVVKGNKVRFTGFGTFEARKHGARKGRNPQTGEEILIPETLVPVFSAGKNFKKEVRK